MYLGYANGKYLDCTINKKTNYYYDGMEGEGYIRGYLNTYPVQEKNSQYYWIILNSNFQQNLHQQYTPNPKMECD